jgi:hypothetical protein
MRTQLSTLAAGISGTTATPAGGIRASHQTGIGAAA